MSQDWRHRAVKGILNHSTRAANALGATDERRHAWRNWASHKIGARLGRKHHTNEEILTLFPGWAARRFQISPELPEGQSAPFEVEVFVSGYAISCRPNGQASRSQRAFIRLAKGFAGVPKFTSTPTEDAPTQMPDEYQVQALDFELQRAKANDSESDSDSLSDKDSSPSYTPSPSSYSPSPSPSPTPPPKQLNTAADLIQKLHYNLESRLQLFWSSTLPSRTIRLHLFTPAHRPSHNSTHSDDHIPLASQNVTTGVDGSFNVKFRVNWNDLSKHPRARHIVFSRPIQEHDLLIVAELLPSLVPSAPATTASASTPSVTTSHTPPPTSGSHPHLSSHPHLHSLLSTLSSFSGLTSFLSPSATASTHIRVPITHCPIRVISDIDDTVKMSGVPEGARAVFQNVFMKELKDGVIPGMGEWYSDMWKKGVRFHYVSNGPFEYLPVLHEFFEISKLPPGSIKLKSYAGRSLLSGLLSTPAARKRAGVVDILDAFPDSKFILVGDSGEQDLELYADLARERPNQILAVFIRDAEETCYEPIDDPIGSTVVGAGAAGTRPQSEPLLDYSAPSPALSRQSMTEEDLPTTPRASSFLLDPDGADELYTNRPLSEEPADLCALTGSESCEEDTPKAGSVPAFTDVQHSSTIKNASRTPVTARTLPASPLDGQFITSPPPPTPPPIITPATPHQSHRFQCYMSSSKSKKTPSGSTGSSRSSSPSPLTSSFLFNFRSNSNGSKSGISTKDSSGHRSSGSSRSSSGERVKKRFELQMRVYRARAQIPSEVPLRVFRDPGECGEMVERILGG